LEKHRNGIVFYREIYYNSDYPFQGKSLGKEVVLMTSFDLFWLLVELLLKDKEEKSEADNQKED